MEKHLIQSLWSSMCQSALSHAASMSRIQRNATASELIASESKKFTQQPPPTTNEELSRRQMQQLALSSRIGTISHAASMVQMHPNVAEQVFQHVRQFCDGPLPDDSNGVNELQMASIAISSTMSTLCHADSMDRLRGSFKNDPAFDEAMRLGRELSDDDAADNQSS